MAWFRRALMIFSFLPMVVGNWLLILWAATKLLLILPLSVLMKVLAAPFQLLDNGFIEAWHGRGPGATIASHSNSTEGGQNG
jgi:hypothetical protein